MAMTLSKIGVVIYLLFFLAIDLVFTRAIFVHTLPTWLQTWFQTSNVELAAKCILTGSVGGLLYTLRAVYLSACVRNDWNIRWVAWYLIRPITSAIAGWIAWLFSEAGLLVLDAKIVPNSGELGFLALALIAGLNVDRFLAKVEDVARSLWGIEPSRATTDKHQEKKTDEGN